MAPVIGPAVERELFNHAEPTVEPAAVSTGQSAVGGQAVNQAADAHNLEHGRADQGRDVHVEPAWTRWIDVSILVIGIPASIVGATFVALTDNTAATGFVAFDALLAFQVFLRAVIRETFGSR